MYKYTLNGELSWAVNMDRFSKMNAGERALAFDTWEFGFRKWLADSKLGGIRILTGSEVSPPVENMVRESWRAYEAPGHKLSILTPEDPVAIIQVLFESTDVNGAYKIPNVSFVIGCPLIEKMRNPQPRVWLVQDAPLGLSKTHGPLRTHPHGGVSGRLSGICWYGEKSTMRAIFGLRFDEAIVILTQHIITVTGHHFVVGSKVCSKRGCTTPVSHVDHDFCREHAKRCSACNQLSYTDLRKSGMCGNCNVRVLCHCCENVFQRHELSWAKTRMVQQLYSFSSDPSPGFSRFDETMLVCPRCAATYRCVGCKRVLVQNRAGDRSKFVTLRNRLTGRRISRCPFCAQGLQKEIIHEQEKTKKTRAGEPKYEILERVSR